MGESKVQFWTLYFPCSSHGCCQCILLDSAINQNISVEGPKVIHPNKIHPDGVGWMWSVPQRLFGHLVSSWWLLWEAVKPLGGGDFLAGVDDLGQILRFYSPAQPRPVILYFLTKVRRAVGFLLQVASLPCHDGLYLPGTVSQNEPFLPYCQVFVWLWQ